MTDSLALVPAQNAVIEVAPLERALQQAVEDGNIEGMKDVRAMATALRKGAQARGMGIVEENKAAEVILRAERAMGALLEALFQEGSVRHGGSRKSAGDFGLMSYKDLGITRTGDGANFRRLATIPDDQFEDMLADIKTMVARISKVNFYRPAERERDALRERSEMTEPGFEAFRRGAHLLLGWVVDDEGDGAPTDNRLTYLAADELQQFAWLMRYLAAAYGEARDGR
jgi:hypothetical protein